MGHSRRDIRRAKPLGQHDLSFRHREPLLTLYRLCHPSKPSRSTSTSCSRFFGDIVKGLGEKAELAESEPAEGAFADAFGADSGAVEGEDVWEDVWEMRAEREAASRASA